jgi:hypothetical protein
MPRARTLTIAVLLWVAAGNARAAAPDCPPVEPGIELSGEAAADGAPASVLVILPKGADGAVSSAGLVLAPGARVVESRWSALLCATVARIEGPAGAAPAALIVSLPENAAAVQDDVYETQAEPELSAAPEGAPATAARPDPYRKQQWAFDALGIDAAHAITRGENVRVALLDSRSNIGHEDLRAIALIENETNGARGAAAQHGTLVAGIIGASKGNGAGIAGVAPRAIVLAIPVCQASARGDLCRLYSVLGGLDLAWGQRAQVVNISLVGPANRALERAVRRLDTLGVAIVSASGNHASSAPAYPAAYPWVIGVAATDRSRRLAPTGASVDLTAPGVEIVSTAAAGGYAFASGSSLAAAHTSGALALLTSASGGDVGAARRALFGAAQRTSATTPPALAPLCRALAKLAKPCGDVGSR